MSKLVELISEYFLGTKSREYYTNKTIYFEKIKNNNKITKKESELLSEKIKLCKTAEKRVFLEKMLSNSIEVGFAVTSLITKESVYFYLGCFLGEYARTDLFSYEKKRKQEWDIIELMNNTFPIINSQINTVKELVSKKYKQ